MVYCILNTIRDHLLSHDFPTVRCTEPDVVQYVDVADSHINIFSFY